MVALVVALVSVPVAAGAQDTNDRIASTRAAIDDAASRWFDSKEEVAKLDADIAQLEREVIDTKQRADHDCRRGTGARAGDLQGIRVPTSVRSSPPTTRSTPCGAPSSSIARMPTASA